MGKTAEEIFKALEKLGVRKASAFFSPQPIREVDEETRLLMKARTMGGASLVWTGDLFSRQAQFLARVEPKEAEFEPFPFLPPSYESPYNMMTVAQLRYYLYWRAAFRYGQTPRCHDGYLEVYLREMGLGIGCEEWERLDKCAALLRAYPHIQSSTRRLITQFIIDLYVISPDTTPFWTRMAEAGLTRRDFGPAYEYDTRLLPGSLSYALEHTVYDPRQGNYFEKGDMPRLERAYEAACQAAFDLFEQKKIRGDIVLWGRSHKDASWRPLYIPYSRYQPPKIKRLGQVDIRAGERYILEKSGATRKAAGVWPPVFQTVFIGYLLKKCEARMRIYDKYRHRLHPSCVTLRKDMFSTGLRYKQLSELFNSGEWDPVLDAAIDRALKPPVEPVRVDMSRLGRIREDAEIVRQKLTVEEPQAEMIRPVPPPKPAPKTEPAQKRAGDTPEAAFVCALTDDERSAVVALLKGERASSLVPRGILPQVFWEGINEKALDALGDTVYDPETETIYEDYAQALQAVLLQND